MANAPDRTLHTPVFGKPHRLAGKLWLSMLKDYIYELTTAAAGEYWPPRGDEQTPYYNYRLEHILQVERDALAISSMESGDIDIILASVWVHDRFQPQFGGENHAERAAQWARDYLKFIRFPDSKIPAVCQAIQLHSRGVMDIPEACHEARILWDADHVARMGPADILNFLLCHSSEDFLCGLPANNRFPSAMMTVKDFVPLLMERRPQLFRADWFYFDETRRMARERISVSRAFLDCLEGQVGGS